MEKQLIKQSMVFYLVFVIDIVYMHADQLQYEDQLIHVLFHRDHELS